MTKASDNPGETRDKTLNDQSRNYDGASDEFRQFELADFFVDCELPMLKNGLNFSIRYVTRKYVDLSTEKHAALHLIVRSRGPKSHLWAAIGSEVCNDFGRDIQ